MQIKAVYEDNVLKPSKKLDLKEKTEGRITIKISFSRLIDELGELEPKEDINRVLNNMRTKNYYG